MSEERVVVVSGVLEGKEFLLSGSLSIGRNADNAIFLDDKQVSRKHAVVQQTAAGTILKDLGSGNGTYVEERRILEFRLNDGDVFTIGGSTLRYEGQPAPPEKVAPQTTLGSQVRYDDAATGKVQASAAETVFQTMLSGPPRETVDAEQLRAAQERLAAIYKANEIISSEIDLKRLFERVMDQLFSLVPANNGVIMTADEETGALSAAYERLGGSESEIRVSLTIVNRAFDDGEAVLVYDAADDARFDAAASIAAGNIASAMCVPLVQQGEKLGVIYVDTRGSTNAFTNSDLELMVAFAGPSAIAIKNAQYVEQLERDFHTTLKLLANAIELRDHYTVGHTWRVTNFSVALAEELGWDEERKDLVEMGGVLHDVGKIAVEDAVLRKQGKLTDEEYAQMKIHPERGAALMRDCKKLEPLIPFCLYHHERYDGNGYPYRLKGEDIPVEGRLVAVADTFDAMTSNRPYRKGLDPEIAIEELEKNRGSQFDPQYVDAFIKAYRAGKISHILQVSLEKDEKSIACPFCSTYIPVPDDASLGDVFDCGVCHRNIKLNQQNEAYFGEILRETEGGPGAK